jgi:large subunit ribosomal protein L32e
MNALELRRQMKKRKPAFIRQEWRKNKRLAKVWRKPTGMQSKMRHRKKGHSAVVSVGWRSPRAARGLHRSGLHPVVVQSVADIAKMQKNDGAVIAAGVGMRGAVLLVQELLDRKITILNMREPEKYALFVKARLDERKKAKAESAEKAKTAEKPKAQPKKAEKVEAPKTEEDRKEEERKAAEKILTKGR